MKHITLAILLLLCSIEVTSAQTFVYVAPNGDDITGDGTSALPYKTLTRARDAVRALIGSGLSAPVEVVLAQGTYPQSQPLVFGPGDSGTEAYPITYRAADGARPVISGAVGLNQWTRRGNLWVADATGLSEVFALFTPDELLTRARTPNVGEFYFANGTDGPGAFYTRPADAPSAAWGDGRVDVNLIQQWKHSRHSITGVNGNRVAVSPNERQTLGFYDHAFPYFFDNHPDMLDAPGEWYHDLSAGEILYVPRPGQDISTFCALAPVTDRIVELIGNPAQGQFVSHLKFRGLSFRYANYVADDAATLATAHLGLTDAAIYAFGLTDATFENCEVAYSGGHGVWLYDGCKRNRFEQVYMHDLGGGGIYMKNDPGLERRNVVYSGNVLVEGNQVVNSIITKLSRIHLGSHGVWMGNVSDNLVSHCDISDTNGSGINIGFSDSPDIIGAPNNIVEFTRIHDILYDVNFDWSGIHLLGGTDGTIMRNNLYYNIGGYQAGTYAVYHDNGNGGTRVENSIIIDAAGELVFAKGRNHVYRNNILVNQNGVAHFRFRDDLLGGMDVQQNVIVTGRSRGVFNYDGGRPQVEKLKFDNNLYFCPDCEDGVEGMDFDGGGFDSWQGLNQDVNSVYGDPGFRDPGSFDYGVTSGLAAGLGITPIDVTEIGVTGSAEWTSLAPTTPVPQSEAQQEAQRYLVNQAFADGFEETAVGFLPDFTDSRASWSATRFNGDNAPATVITDETAAGGRQSLLLRDRKTDRQPFNPNVRYYPMYTRAGVATLDFSVRLTADAILVLRADHRDGSTFDLRLLPGRAATVAQSTFATVLPTDEWFYVSIALPIASANTEMTVRIRSSLGDETQNVALKPGFKWARALFLADANADANVYLDDIAFDFTAGVEPQPTDDGYVTPFETDLTVDAPGVLTNDGEGGVVSGVIDGPTDGTLQLSADGSFTYTPAAGFVGVDRFTYEVDYGGDRSGVALVEIRVTESFAPPGGGEPTVFRVDENAPNGTVVGVLTVAQPVLDLRDDFADGDATAWTQRSASFNESGGTFNSVADGEAYLGPLDAVDYTVEATVKLSQGGGGNTLGIVGRYTPQGNYYAFRLNGNGRVQLVNYVNDTPAGILGAAPAGIVINQAYVLRLEMNGEQLRGYVDGQLVIDITDATHAAGAPGVVSIRGIGTVDDFRAFTEVQVSVVAADDFDDSDAAAWAQTPEVWTESGGRFANSGDGVAIFTPYSGTDYTVSADVRLDFVPVVDNGNARTIGISGRHDGATAYYVWRLHSRTRLQLVRIGSPNAVLYDQLTPLTSGQDYRMAMSFTGDTIRAYIDGELIVTAVDGAHSRGEAGVVTLRGLGSVDNFEITAKEVAAVQLNGLSDPGRDINENGVAPFALNTQTGEITVADVGDLDKEAFAGPFRLVASVGRLSAKLPVDVRINDVNDNAPVITDAGPMNIDRGLAAGSVVTRVNATDGDVSPTTFSDWTIVSGNPDADGDGVFLFAITQQGEITLDDADELSSGDFVLGVTVSDGVNVSAPGGVRLRYRRLVPPAGLRAFGVEPNQIALRWTDRSDEEGGYVIERTTGDGTLGFQTLDTVAANVTTYVDGTVSVGVTYRYRVSATLGAQRSDPSNEASITAPELYLLAKNAERHRPEDARITTQLRVVNQGGQAVDLADLSIRYWFTNDSQSDLLTASVIDPIDGTTGEPVLRYGRVTGQNADTYLEVALPGGTLAGGQRSDLFVVQSEAVLGKLSERDDYSYLDNLDILPTAKVTLYRDGELIWGVEPVTVDPTGQLAPINLSAAEAGPSAVTLTWTGDATAASRYQIERAPAGGSFVVIARVPGGETFTDRAAATPKDQWTYRVAALDSLDRVGPYSNEARLRGPSLVLRAKNLDRVNPTGNALIKTQYRFQNLGEVGVDLARVTVRYWLTAEPGLATISTRVTRLPAQTSGVTATAGATAAGGEYLQLGFADGTLAGGQTLGDLFVTHAAPAALDETNDYSYLAGPNLAATDRITVYYDGRLVWGVEPDQALRSRTNPSLRDATQELAWQSADARQAQSVQLDAYPNPARGGAEVSIELRGEVARETDEVSVVDALGRIAYRMSTGAGEVPTQTLALPTGGLATGLYTVRCLDAAGALIATGRLIVVD